MGLRIIRPTPPLLVAGLILAGPAEAKQPDDCRPTLAQYKAIPKGISYAKAKAKLGCAGQRVSSLDVGVRRSATYSWYGRGSFGANLNLTFTNGRLSDKSQLGLN